jgi:hypothetical protein
MIPAPESDLSEYPNSPSNLVIRAEISSLYSIPDHQQGITCELSPAKSRLGGEMMP